MARKVTIPGQNVPIQIGNAINPDWYLVLKFLETLQPLSDVDFAAIDAAIALKSNITRTINPQTGTSYTFVLSDAGIICEFSNSSPVTVTVPPNSSVAFPVGTQIEVTQTGAGKTTLAQGSGVLITSLASYKSIAGQYASATLYKRATDTWQLSGSLIA